MTLSHLPLRSMLYIPASKARALEKAKTLPVDSIIFDLEDAVAVDAKAEARDMLGQSLMGREYNQVFKIVRINGLNTPWVLEDAQRLCDWANTANTVDAVLLPKINTAQDVDKFASMLPGDMPLWAMIETPLGVLNAAEIAGHDRIAGFVAGTNDLAKELGAQAKDNRSAMHFSLQQMVLAAKAHNIAVIDGVYNAFRDEEGLRAELQEGRNFGFDGKSLIHPLQVEATNAVFSPSLEDVSLAERKIEAFRIATSNGEAVAVVDGEIVEYLHVTSARKVIEFSKAIAKSQ